jgi:hypothetical protein
MFKIIFGAQNLSGDTKLSTDKKTGQRNTREARVLWSLQRESGVP